MQKFTRSLTREIEVGGERLAVTLGVEGVTIRPVGSRRPPHTLSWPAIVCATTGHLPPGATPSDQEIATALVALRTGAPAQPVIAPVAALAALPPTSLPALLERLDRWLARERARYHQGLLPPASIPEIDALGQALGKPVPEELRQWLSWRNGQNEELIGAFYQTFNLLSAAQIIAAWQDRQTNPEPGWNNAWIPLLDDYQGDLIVLDSTLPGCPVREVWRGRTDHAVVAPNLTTWIEAFLRDVEAGRYSEDVERGEFHRLKSHD
jgi:cell wall assembly regulator SMI1